MTREKPFSLTVEKRRGADYGVALRQRSVNGTIKEFQVVRIWGTPFRCTLDVVLESLRRCGHQPTRLARSLKQPLALDETTGVRLGLLYLAVKPLRRVDRIESITRAIREMEPEELYYWYSKLMRPHDARRAGKALRVLLARE